MRGTQIELRRPYLLFMGDITDPVYTKTALGIAQWCPEKCLGQLRLSEHTFSAGLPDLSIAQAADQGAGSLVVGIAPVGGRIEGHWVTAMIEAAEAGLDIVSGMHSPLAQLPGLSAAAQRGGGRLIDIRVPPKNLPIATGNKRAGQRLLTVGTDCAVGKKYTALALTRVLEQRGLAVSFRASGQTGIMISGAGIPIDATVCDFTAGAAEALSPENDAHHWDVIEGQGSLFHPAYAGVSLALLHGSQPDAIVLCHEAGRENIAGFPHFKLPEIVECISVNLQQARLTNPAVRCVGVSVNTSALPEAGRDAWLQQLSGQLGLPCVDPLHGGTEPIIDRLLEAGDA